MVMPTDVYEIFISLDPVLRLPNINICCNNAVESADQSIKVRKLWEDVIRV